ncbi:MAG TPA: FAD-dependent oxidoreductase [Bryobacteraceae bacterium]|nr:FAD-dependent oxidoreductase [Bryobacteraceae bacterium]
MPSSRRGFLSAALIGLTAKAAPKIEGGFVNDAFPAGHRLRDHAPFSKAGRTEKFPIVIVGGGMAGLCAAWRLNKRGFRDFVLLEMEPQAGGNSRWGENEITAYPWAAHYVPVPDTKAAMVRELFEELGVFRDGKWDERRLCFAPQERLYLHGRWQEGIEPEIASTARDREDYVRFHDKMTEFRASGEFTIPMERGARPSPLDQLSMQDWMTQNRFESPYLNWYINYACRDDYGALARDTSAWAGVHYFASRDPEEKGPLTWPEGNGWIVRQLQERLQPWLRTSAPVYAIAREGNRLRVRTEQTDYLAERVIFAAPTFLASYIVEGAPSARGFVYSPWLTANLTIEKPPEETAWDNVIFDSPALGYVDATHMSLRSVIERSVWTFYWALANQPPEAMRSMLLEKSWTYWREEILRDLSRAHPDIRDRVSRIDVMRIGHAMARPVPGFLDSEARRHFATSQGPVYYANSDLSGFSIFEEAQYRGVTAADRALKDIGRA